METVSARIYSTVKEQIVQGHYPPGSKITEQQIAAEFQTSRTPVREAMRLLVADGFVLFKPNSGSVVRSWAPEEIVEIFNARVLLESEVAAEAALRISDSELTQLIDVQEKAESLKAPLRGENASHLSKLNREFHRVIARASGNARLTMMLASAIEMPVVQQTFRRYTPEQLQRSFAHHRELIDAFAARDASWARAVMSCHIHAAKHALLGRGGDGNH